MRLSWQNAEVNTDYSFYFKIKLLLQGMKGAIRDDTLLQLKVPTMFVQVKDLYILLKIDIYVKERVIALDLIKHLYSLLTR